MAHQMKSRMSDMRVYSNVAIISPEREGCNRATAPAMPSIQASSCAEQCAEQCGRGHGQAAGCAMSCAMDCARKEGCEWWAVLQRTTPFSNSSSEPYLGSPPPSKPHASRKVRSSQAHLFAEVVQKR